jgi:hypothetical protein
MNINVPYYCNICLTKNNNWTPVYYQTDGQMLKLAKGIYISVCKSCNKVKILDVQKNLKKIDSVI